VKSKFFIYCALASASATLIGCTNESKEAAAEPVNPVSYYVEHKAEREALLKKCLDDATLLVTPNCQNAKSAAVR
jgi:hypothetical protein